MSSATSASSSKKRQHATQLFTSLLHEEKAEEEQQQQQQQSQDEVLMIREWTEKLDHKNFTELGDQVIQLMAEASSSSSSSSSSPWSKANNLNKGDVTITDISAYGGSSTFKCKINSNDSPEATVILHFREDDKGDAFVRRLSSSQAVLCKHGLAPKRICGGGSDWWIEKCLFPLPSISTDEHCSKKAHDFKGKLFFNHGILLARIHQEVATDWFDPFFDEMKKADPRLNSISSSSHLLSFLARGCFGVLAKVDEGNGKSKPKKSSIKNSEEEEKEVESSSSSSQTEFSEDDSEASNSNQSSDDEEDSEDDDDSWREGKKFSEWLPEVVTRYASLFDQVLAPAFSSVLKPTPDQKTVFKTEQKFRGGEV